MDRSRNAPVGKEALQEPRVGCGDVQVIQILQAVVLERTWNGDREAALREPKAVQCGDGLSFFEQHILAHDSGISHTISDIPAQAEWENKEAPTGNHTAAIKQAILLHKATAATGTIRTFTRRLTGVNRLK